MRHLTKFLVAATFLIGITAGTPPTHAAESAGFNWIVGPGDLAFGAGGMRSRFIIIEEWNSTTNYPANTLLKHNGNLYVALNDPATGQEPGVAAVWLQATGITGGQADGNVTGATFTDENGVQQITITTSQGGPFEVNISDLTTATEVAAAIASVTGNIPVLDDATFNSGPTAAQATAQQIVQHEGRLWVAEVDPNSTNRSVSFRAYTNTNYRGVVYNEPPSPQVDDFWFATSTHQWEIQDTGGVVRRLHTQNAHFIDGDYPTRDEAEAAVGEEDDVIVYPNGQGVFVAHQVQSFTAGTTSYRYAPLDSRIAADAPLEIDNTTGHIRLGGITFLRSTDTPASYAGASRYEVRVNTAGTGLEFLDEQGVVSALPVVDRLPDATLSGAHEVVFLTHGYTEGVRQDATVLVASPFLGDSGLVGYASSVTGDPAGSTTYYSPMDELYGVGTTSNFGLDTVATFTNQIWMNNANRIVINNTDYFLGESFVYRGRTVRRILSAPSGINNTSVSVNFRRPDDSYYFTDGSSVRHLSGLYELREGAYHKLISRGLVHVDGLGAPADAPTEAAQSYVDDLGRLWISGDRRVEIRSPHAVADERFDHSYLVQAPSDFAPLIAIGDGAFALQATTDEFAQIRGDSLNDLATSLSWQDVWAYLFSEDLDTSDQIRNLRDNSVWLGRFPSRDEMVQDLVEAIGTGSFAANTYYFAITSDRIIREVTSFAAGDVTHRDELFWNGPFATESDAVSIVENYIIEYGGHGRPSFAPDSGGQLAINDSGDIYVSASEIVDHSTNPIWQLTVRTVPEATGAWPYWRGAEPREDVSGLTADGYFNYAAAEHQWYVEFANADHEGDWASVVELFRTEAGLATIRNAAPSGLLPGIAAEASVFLAGPDTVFANDAEAAIFVSAQGIADAATKPFTWFTGDVGNPFGWQLRVVDAGGYQAGTVQRIQTFHWLGPIDLGPRTDATEYYPIGTGRVGGTGDEITLATGQSLASVPHGAMFIFEATAANTGATTVSVDGNTAIRVERSNGAGGSTPLTGGEITARDVIILVYEANFGLFHWIPGHMGLLARENEVGNDELTASLRDEIAQGGRPIAGLRYVISEAATTPDAPSARWNGNVFQAHRDMTIRGFSYYRGAVNELSIPYAGTCFPVTRASASDYRTSTVSLWNIRLNDGPWQTNQISIPDNQFGELELRAPGDGFHLDRDDYFACMAFFRLVAGQTNISTGIVGATGSTEQDHADHSFNENLMSYVARASINRADRFFSNQNIFNNTTHSIRMEIHYDALPTQFRDGVVDAGRCDSNRLILERSEGLSDLPIDNGCLDIDALTNLASNAIQDVDEFVLYDTTEDSRVSITQGELAARLADGTTITSAGGTLTAVGGSGEANVQADWDETDTSDDSYIQNKPTLGTAAAADTGEDAGDVPVLEGASGVLSTNVIPPTLSPFVDIQNRPNLASDQVSDTDQFLLYDASADANVHVTEGGVAARLADATTITSAGGTLSVSANVLDQIHGGSTAINRAIYEIQGGITAPNTNSQNNHVGNIFQANADIVVYEARMFAQRGSTNQVRYRGRIFPIVRVSDTNWRVATANDINTNDPIRNLSVGGDFAEFVEVSTTALQQYEVRTSELNGMPVAEGDYFAVVLSAGSGNTFAVSNRDSTPTINPHVGDGDFPFTGFALAAPFRVGSLNYSQNTNVYNVEGDRVVRMQVDYGVAGGALMVGYDEGTQVFAGAATPDCVGSGITCSENSDGRFEINVPGGGAADGTVDTATLAATTDGDIALSLGRTVGADVPALLDIDGTPPNDHPRLAWDPVNNRFRWDRERLLLLSQAGQTPYQVNQINFGFEAANALNILGGNLDSRPGQLRATITIPEPIDDLDNLVSSAIQDTDEFRIYDGSDSEDKSVTQGELAARLADGTTITSSGGTLSAVGGSGGGLGADDIQDFAVLARENTLWGTHRSLRSQVNGDTRVGQHFGVAPVGEEEAIKYRSFGILTPGLRGGAEYLSGIPGAGTPHAGGDVLLQQRTTPDPFPIYLSGDGAEATTTGFNFTLQGTDPPYFTWNATFGNSGTQLVNWESLAVWVKMSRVDGNGGFVEGVLPWNADVGVGADVRGDPYSARPWHLRGYLGLDRLPDFLSTSTLTINEAERRGYFTDTDVPERDFNQTMLEWVMRPELFNYPRIFGGNQSQFANELIATTTIASDTLQAQASLPVASVAGILENEEITVEYGENLTDTYTVSVISGTNLFLTPGLVRDYTAGTIVRHGTEPTQAMIDSYRIRIDVALMDAGDPRIDWRDNSVVYSRARQFTEDEKTKLGAYPAASDCSDGEVPTGNGSGGFDCETPTGSGDGSTPFDGNLTGDLTVGGEATVTGDINAGADVLIDDNEHLILGGDTDFSMDYDASETEVEIRLGSDPTGISVYEGTGTTAQHTLEKDGDASHAGNLTVGGTMTVTGTTTLSGSVVVGGVTVTGDLEAQNDIHLGDRDQLVLGTDSDASFDFDDRTNEVEIRLGTPATAFSIYDGTGNNRRFRFSRDGTSTLGGTVTAQGNLLPNTSGTGAVGTGARAWGSGTFVDVTVTDDLTVTDDATVTGDLAVTGSITRGGAAQLSLVCSTQANYDALTTPANDTLYVIAASCP